MVEPFQEVNFLTRSENRVRVLTALADTTRTQEELVERTEISEITISRCLDQFRERGWVRGTDGGYETTAVGTLIAEDYVRFEESMDVAARLGPEIDLLPTDRMDFDLRHLTRARITDPDEHEMLRVLDRWVGLIRNSDHVRTLVYVAGEVAAEAVTDALTDNDLRFEAVIPSHHLANVRETPSLREAYRGIIEAGGSLSVAHEDPQTPYSVALFDGLVAIAGFDSTGTIRVGIESRADPVRDWAERTYAAYAEEATALAPGDLEK